MSKNNVITASFVLLLGSASTGVVANSPFESPPETGMRSGVGSTGTALHRDERWEVIGSPTAPSTLNRNTGDPIGSVTINEFRPDGLRRPNRPLYRFRQVVSPPAGTVANARFGEDVALDNTTLAVGSPGNNQIPQAGAVHVYELEQGSWEFSQTLKPIPNAVNFTGRGSSVDVFDDHLVMGAHVRGSGQAFLYERSATSGRWVNPVQLGTLVPPRLLGQNDRFGIEVAADDDTVFVAADGDDANGLDAGAVYVFEKSFGSWEFVQRLTASDGDIDDGFGISMAIDGDQAVIGSLNETGYVFERNANGRWVEAAALVGTNPASAVDLVEDSWIVTGSPTTESAYVYRNDPNLGWLIQAVVQPDFDAQGYFGAAVALTKNDFVIGAPDANNQSGSTTTFSLQPRLARPLPGTVLSNDKIRFSWLSNGWDTVDYMLHIGSTPGASDLYESGSLGADSSSDIVPLSALPSEQDVFVRLFYRVMGDDTLYFLDESYVIAEHQLGVTQPIVGTCIDNDGDGFGWNQFFTCDPTDPDNIIDPPPCIDRDGDGFGWDGRMSCIP